MSDATLMLKFAPFPSNIVYHPKQCGAAGALNIPGGNIKAGDGKNKIRSRG